MDKAQLKDGLAVILTKDVTNPKPDRRKARDWAAHPIWKRGTRLLVKGRAPTFYLDSGSTAASYISFHEDGFSALVEACEPAPRTLDNILFSASRASTWLDPSSRILELLVHQGTVSLDAVEAAIAQIHNEDAAEAAAQS